MSMMFNTVLLLLAIQLTGGDSLFCDDLSLIPELPRVDYPTEIQPLFDGHCTGCHGGAGGLSLRGESSYGHLYCAPTQTSTPPPDSRRVVPFDPAGSWLFLRVNCDTDQFGFRMPPSSPLSTTDQALMRDWIAQGARPSAESLFDSSFENQETCAAP